MEEDVCEEYKSSLLDLTCNSKPLINMLTMLAEENIQQAPRIVRSIEEHLQKVPIDMKLPVLYLIDSIMKNVGGAYRALFTQNVVSNFCNIFEKGDEKMRMQLFKLRQTWAEIFPNKKLFALDTKVKQMDPAWPVMAKEPQQMTTIHVNPKFFEAKATAERQQALDQQVPKPPSLNSLPKPSPTAQASQILNTTAPSAEGEQVQRMLLQKQQEFILLHQQKLQLEMHMQHQQLKQKQDAEQLLKNLKPSPGHGPLRGVAPAQRSADANILMRPQMRPQPPVIARDPRLQQRVASPIDFPRLPAPSVGPLPSTTPVVSAPPTQTSTVQPEKAQTSPDKRSSSDKGSSSKEDRAPKSPPKKFRIPKTTDRKKTMEEGGKESVSGKGTPTKACKASEDKDERQNRSASSSPGRGKKSRGKGSKPKGEENICPSSNGGDKTGAIAEALQTGDVDMRIIPEKKKDPPRDGSPQHKKQKGPVGEAVLGDIDYRRTGSSAASNGSQRGWAQYKAAHPDEYKSPLRPARENMDGKDEDLRQSQNDIRGSAMGRGGFHGRGAIPPNRDRFGRPLLRKLMSDPRFRTQMVQGGSSEQNMQLQQQLEMERMLSDPEVFLQQAEEQLRAGRLNPDVHRELKAELEKLSQFRKSQPQSPLVPMGWPGGLPGPGFPGWIPAAPFPGMNPPKAQQELPAPSEPAPAVGAIRVDTKMRKVQFVEDVAVVLMDGTETRQITFKGPPKRVFVDELEPFMLSFDGVPKEFVSKRTGKKRTIKFGAPLREIFLDGVPYSAQFGTEPLVVKTADGEIHVIRLEAPPPTVDIEKRPPEHILRLLGLHPEKLANTDSDLRSLSLDPSKPASADSENSMDVDMRLLQQKAPNKDVDLRKHVDPSESEAALGKGSWNGPQRGNQGSVWVPPPRPPEDGSVQQGQDSGGWVRYGRGADERPPPNSSWPQQPIGQPQQQPQPQPQSQPQPQQDQAMQHWNQGPGEWNNFGGEFQPGRNVHGVGPSRRGGQHGFPVKEFPSYFREDFPHPQIHPHHIGVGEVVRPGFMQPQFPCRPPGFPGAEGNMAPAPQHQQLGPHMGPPPPPPQGMMPPNMGGTNVAPLPPPPMPLPGTEPPPPRGVFMVPPSQPPAISMPFPQIEAPAPQVVGPPPAPALEVNVGELFSKLVAAGILKQNAGNGSASSVGEPPQQQLAPLPHHHPYMSQKKRRRRPRLEHPRQEPKRPTETVPQLSFFKTDQLKVKHPSVISALHVGTQCASCGLRFTDEKCEKYRQHLDWHFRANRRDKDGARKAFSRKWFYELEDWIQFEEIEDMEERARSFFEQQATVEQDQSSDSPITIKSVPASGDETENTCAVCEEAFQLFWVEEEEEWHFRDAVRIENKVYHPACYEDFKRAAEAPSSPVRAEPEEAPPDSEEKETPMEVDDVKVKAEAVDEARADKAATDEQPAEEMAVDEEASTTETAVTTDETKDTLCDKELPIKDEKAGDEMQEDPVVIVDNLGEFGVSISDGEQSGGDDDRPPETLEPKVVVKGTGGIVMKVKAESIQAPVSPMPTTAASVSDVCEAGSDEPAPATEEPSTDEEEFRPPTPDPRFQSLPPVQRGNELSGLCCIM